MSADAVLEVADLHVTFSEGVQALRGVSFSLSAGETLAVVGESGSGKTTLSLCLLGLIQPPQARGSVRVCGQSLDAPEDVLRKIRWEKAAISLQGAPFNPVVPVGDQLAEPLRQRLGVRAGEARRRVDRLAEAMDVDPRLLDAYPHELSGGERRRAAVAMALTLDPELVVLDEPTAGLDPESKRAFVGRLGALARDRGFALVLVTHDLTDASRLAARTLVLYAGESVEMGATSAVIAEPAHPYTWSLVNAYPVMTTTKEMRPIRGLPPDPRAVPPGCSFHLRCSQAEDVCRTERPVLATSRSRLVACHFGGLKTLVSATAVSKTYRGRRGEIPALLNVSISVREGEAVGIVGPSGSGKSTLAKILTGQLEPDSGEVVLQGQPFGTQARKELRRLRRRIQLVMQDPWDALSPRLTVAELVREPLDLAGEVDTGDRDAKVAESLATVGLPASGSFLSARTAQLSGGQLQRIALARALVAAPKVLIADEPTAMLDASEQARLLVALRERQMEMGLGLVLISHDMAVVRKVTDRIVVLDGGRVVEQGPSHLVSSQPRSPAGRRLVDAAPAFAVTEASDDDTRHHRTTRRTDEDL